MTSKTKKRPPIVYSAVNTLSGDEYIGITSMLLCQRRGGHLAYAIKHDSQTHFHRAIRKYGTEAFRWTIIVECPDYESAKKKEIELISERRPRYNMTKGGDGIVGFKFTPEQVARMAAERRGKPGPWRNKTVPQSFLEGGAAWRGSDAGRESWANSRIMGPQASARSVICLNDGIVYKSISGAAKAYGIEGSSISAVCRKRRASAGRRVFRYPCESHGGALEAEAIIAQAKARQSYCAKPRYIKPVICMTDGELFDSVGAAAKHYELNAGTVIASCKHRHIYDRKNKPIFSYLDEYRRSID